eukprot:gb/GEZN01011226.1/.p1 GENE.gb/GEZN01011226.1/~~gb/GEZN01011226.1/.p1  ORF type:complete len:260 (+),score=38.98 gb/GEZN01011226.1/:259-1038(+)
MFRRAGRLYSQCLQARPFQTQGFIVAGLCVTGEVMQQGITYRTMQSRKLLTRDPSDVRSVLEQKEHKATAAVVTREHVLGQVAEQDGRTHTVSILSTARSGEGSEDDTLAVRGRRILAAAMYGAFFSGPFGHFWYGFLDEMAVVRFKLSPASFRLIAFKLPLDAVVGMLFLTVFLFTYNFVADQGTLDDFLKTMRDDFPATYAADSSWWCVVQIFNFRYVPVVYQLLVVATASVIEMVALSYVQDHGLPAFPQAQLPDM